MDNSMALARFIGPYIIVIGVGLLLNLKYYQSVMEGFFKSPALVYVTGLITFVAGLAVVLLHNVWVMDWRLIITLLGWNALIKGIILVVFPSISAKMTERLVRSRKLITISWAIMLAIGIFLTSKGY